MIEVIRGHVLQGVFREDLFLNPQSQDHIIQMAREIEQGHYEIRGPIKPHKLHDWLTDWQENNES